MARKSKKNKAPKAPEVIQGDDHGKDVIEQTQEARGIDKDNRQIDPGTAGSAASKPPLTDEMKARDAQIKEREEYLADQGLDPDHERNFGGGGMKKVELADVKQKMYRGTVTCSSVHAGTHEKISARIDLPEAVGEERVWLDFKAHHANAMREYFEIDPENKTDPNLRSRFE